MGKFNVELSLNKYLKIVRALYQNNILSNNVSNVEGNNMYYKSIRNSLRQISNLSENYMHAM